MPCHHQTTTNSDVASIMWTLENTTANIGTLPYDVMGGGGRYGTTSNRMVFYGWERLFHLFLTPCGESSTYNKINSTYS